MGSETSSSFCVGSLHTDEDCGVQFCWAVIPWTSLNIITEIYLQWSLQSVSGDPKINILNGHLTNSQCFFFKESMFPL